MTVRLTKRKIDSLRVGELAWDPSIPGFGARCRGVGNTSYVLKYRSGSGRSGRQRWFTIGRHGVPWTVEDARREATQLLGRIARGEDPSADRQRSRKEMTVSDLGRRFIAEYTAIRSKPRTLVEYRALFEGVIGPTVGRIKASGLTRADVARMHHERRDTPYHANRAIAVLSAAINWGIRVGLIPEIANPCRHVRKFAENKRERFLSDVELARLGATLREAETVGLPILDKQGKTTKERSPAENVFAVAAIRLLILTGCRRDEILTLKWDHVDFENRCLRLPDSKSGAKTVRLNAPALEVLSALPRLHGSPFVIVGRDGLGRLVGLRRIWLRVAQAAGLIETAAPDARAARKDIGKRASVALKYRLHDLRHSFASVGAGVGLGLPIIGALLGHSQPATTARYAHLADDPVRKATDAIGQHLDTMMKGNGEGGKVVAMSRTASAA